MEKTQMKYFCVECGEEFDEDDGLVTYLEPHSELAGCPVEILCEIRCPYCGMDWQGLEEAGDEKEEPPEKMAASQTARC